MDIVFEEGRSLSSFLFVLASRFQVHVIVPTKQDSDSKGVPHTSDISLIRGLSHAR